MSDDEFGFSDEAANREADPFAEMSEEEFNTLFNVSTLVMEKREITDRQVAIEVAKTILVTFDKVMTGSGRIGFRKYGDQGFRNAVMEALADGAEPCQHGHIELITQCGTCYAQARINKVVQNPTSTQPPRKACTHARIDWSGPCPGCLSEIDEEEQLTYELRKRKEYEERMEKLATAPHSKSVDNLQRLLQKTGSTGFQRLQGMTSEMNALIGLLLDKLGGEVELGPAEMDYFKELTTRGESTYSVRPSTTSVALIVERQGPTGRRPFASGGYVKPNISTRSNPSAQPAQPAWMTAHDPQDEEDLPF